MNIQECDVLLALMREPYVSQRMLAEVCGHSIGIVNRSIKKLVQNEYVDDQMRPTEEAMRKLREQSPKNAIILAAGFGMRMVPINKETPKALIEVNGEPLIERIIKQLHAVKIEEIYVVVGFMKERFEYLIDSYGVKLVVNPEYMIKNNLHSLMLVLDHLSNSYVIPCDIWCKQNPFRQNELYSWYMVSELFEHESAVRVNRKRELVSISSAVEGNAMIGISYLVEEQAQIVREHIARMAQEARHNDDFWEEALFDKDKMIVSARVVYTTDVVEINTYEQLRDIDSNSNQLKSDAILSIVQILGVKKDEIMNIKVLKKGMTNRSFLFTCQEKKYIMRIPGEGTNQLIDRRREMEIYKTISGKHICDDIVYINDQNGYKISVFMEGARVCDPNSESDINKCMKRLRAFHDLGLQVDYEFDIFEQINFYEALWDGIPSVYKDYERTKENVFSLKTYINEHIERKVLTHIDAVPDNFLFVKNEYGEEDIYLIDWEYAGMQDPHLDIAMFCIYALYNKSQIDCLINAYFGEGCSDEIRIKIYCYVAVGGLLWSNWCEYKSSLGVEFGEYSLQQYRYAKEYYKIVRQELQKKVKIENG